MASLEQRITALEKLVKAAITKRMEYVVINAGKDAPEECERKQRQIADLKAAGQTVIIYEVI